MKKVKIIKLKPILTDDEVDNIKGKLLPKGYYKKVIKNQDVDVYKEDGTILLKLRKNVLPKNHIDQAYNNIIEHARKYTTTRGMTAGKTEGQPLITTLNKKIMSNIIGYFDTFGPSQKRIFTVSGMERPECRETTFTAEYPMKWKKIIPLIKDIDKQYKELFPSHYKSQYKACCKTNHRIKGTCFSTVTTNLNLQTAVHTDKGDYKDGFGNLVVIEKGKYKGGYTGFPKYGVAVDLRTGDFLGMDVHEFHGNTPLEGKEGKYERLSLVCYFREAMMRKCDKSVPIYKKEYFEKAKELSKGKFRKN